MSIKIEDYNYELPAEQIAQYPLEKRDESKILIYKNREISEDIFRNIADYIQPESLMVFNNTKVIKARIFFYKSTGAEIEILLLEPAGGKTYEEALAAYRRAKWVCIIGNASKWKQGSLKKILTKDNEGFTLEVERIHLNDTHQEERDYFTL
ncbi:MAG TPA: S-adenosylmethionine:tRNA ribosyltransferase-isomerase, partial [Ignavibacteria bacterium]|nr:S-adenosylmethionine:tRNA ribosyltransferase-isomerase [Ignavibacteria bacterium]